MNNQWCNECSGCGNAEKKWLQEIWPYDEIINMDMLTHTCTHTWVKCDWPLYNGIVLSFQKEWSTDVYNNVDGSLKHFA